MKALRRLLILCALCVLASVLFNLFYTAKLNPEVVFFNRVYDATDSWAAQLRQESDAPCYITSGGSSGRTGYDAALMKEEFGVRLINGNGGAGFGLPANVELALQYARPGDTFLLTFEAIECGAVVAPSSSGSKFAFQRLGFSCLDSGLMQADAQWLGDILTGDSISMATYITKKMAGMGSAMYKYDELCTVHPSGWMEIFYREPSKMLPAPFLGSRSLSIHAFSASHINYLTQLQSLCRLRGIKLNVMLPNGYNLRLMRAHNAWICLQYMKLGIPVIKESMLGVVVDASLFADMARHPTTEGAQLISRATGRALQSGEYWTREELIYSMQSYGWGEDGLRLNPAER